MSGTWGALDPGGLRALRESDHRRWPPVGSARQPDGLVTAERSEGSSRRFTEREDAVRWAREVLVPEHGCAVVVQEADGLVLERAVYRRAVPDVVFDDVAARTGIVFPSGWQAVLRRPSWMSYGELPSGAFVEFFDPDESVRITEDWLDARGGGLPFVLVVGGNGAREMFVVDRRLEDAPIYLLDHASEGWQDALPQAENAAALLTRIDDGTFTFDFGDD